MDARTSCLALALSFSLSVAVAASPSISTDKKIYKAEESVTVTFSVETALPDRAWIGIVPAEIPHGFEKDADRHDVTYEYVSGQASGRVSLKAPIEPGSWDVRLLDGKGSELAHASFEVMRPDYARAAISLDAEAYDPGSPIKLRYTAPEGLAKSAWIGLIPAKVPHGDGALNDRHDVAYKWMRDTGGEFTFTAPEKGGAWSFRMHASSPGNEIASIEFTVRTPDLKGATMSLDKDTFIPGETMRLSFEAPEGLSPKGWIGIVPAEIPHGSETENDRHDVAWRYMESTTKGTMEFRAPAEGGSYDFRMHDSDQDGREIATLSFTVKRELDASDLKQQIEREGRVAVYGIRFATDKAEINAESASALAQIARLLGEDTTLNLRIDGHTDNVGDEGYNLQLSKQRAKSVKEHLVAVHGVDASRLSTEGFGEAKPVASNDTEGGRAQNRRVELVRR